MFCHNTMWSLETSTNKRSYISEETYLHHHEIFLLTTVSKGMLIMAIVITGHVSVSPDKEMTFSIFTLSPDFPLVF